MTDTDDRSPAGARPRRRREPLRLEHRAAAHVRVPAPTHAPPPHPPVPVPPGRAGGGHPGPRSTNPARLAVVAGLVLLAGVAGGWPLLVMILALIVMIFLHELGHYLTARWAGMKVTEFFIGFGPRVWSFRRGETEYGLKAIPAGAYVKIIGMNNLDEFDPADADRTYMSKSLPRRLSVAVAGSTMHFLLAALCFFLAFGVVGIPGGLLPFDERDVDALEARVPWVVDDVTPRSAAAAAGVEPGDTILTVDGVEVPTFAAFAEVVVDRPGEQVEVVVEREGRRRTLEATIGERDGRGFFGVSRNPFSLADLPTERSGVLDAIADTGDAYVESIRQTFSGLGRLLSPSGIADIAGDAFSRADDDPGPVVTGGGSGGQAPASGDDRPRAVGLIGVSNIGSGLLGDGEFGYWLAVFATINIFIGFFNLVPLLPLDGGHVAIALYEKVQAMRRGVRRYHVDAMKLVPITYAVVAVLGFLMVSIMVLDTRTLVGS